MPFIQFQHRRDPASTWATNNPVLASGEMGIETDTSLFKIGNGATGWVGLPYGGMKGATGASMTGPTGSAGAAGSGFRFRGSYNKTISYVKNDVVINNDPVQAAHADPFFNGLADNNTYIFVNNTPYAGLNPKAGAAGADGEWWSLFTSKGSTGPAGPTGPGGGGASLSSGSNYGDYLFWNNGWTAGNITVSLGAGAGQTSQGTQSVAIGHLAGNVGQQASSVAVGREAGRNNQLGSAVAVGALAGTTNQGSNTIAMGIYAGAYYQGNRAIAIGSVGGYTGQGADAVAVGNAAGNIGQGSASVAVGSGAGQTSQGVYSVAVGANAGQSSQKYYSVAVGTNAGQVDQNTNSVAIGFEAAKTGQNIDAIAVGTHAAEITQGPEAIAIGSFAGTTNQGSQAIAIGRLAGRATQGTKAVSVGTGAGYDRQGNSSLAIGYQAGQTLQGANSIVLNATGFDFSPTGASALYIKPIREPSSVPSTFKQLSWDATSGEIVAGAGGGGGTSLASGSNYGDYLFWNNGWTVGSSIVKIGGALAGRTDQADQAIAIGNGAGNSGQQLSSLAIGTVAGYSGQGQYSVAIGTWAGYTNQGPNAIALGQHAGQSSQGSNAIALGELAGRYSQGANSIILNATGAELNATTSGFFVKPINKPTALPSGFYPLYWNPTSGEIMSGNIVVPATNDVTTIAGSTSGILNGLRTSTKFNSPYDIAIDSIGNLYVADAGNHRIRKITSRGVVSTFAGDGTAAFADGQGTSAKFNSPRGICIDSNDNIYVCDTSNQRIRKITPGGAVSTFSGNGTFGGTDGAANITQFINPEGITVDMSDNSLYVADTGAHTIRKITSAGISSLFSGSGGQGLVNGQGIAVSFNYPKGIAIDSSGNLYVGDTDNMRIRKITSAGVVSTFAGGASGFSAGFADGSGASAAFYYPSKLTVDSGGNLYVSDTNNHRIRKITPAGLVSTIAGDGTAAFADANGVTSKFSAPRGIVIDLDNTLYICDNNNQLIRKISL